MFSPPPQPKIPLKMPTYVVPKRHYLNWKGFISILTTATRPLSVPFLFCTSGKGTDTPWHVPLVWFPDWHDFPSGSGNLTNVPPIDLSAFCPMVVHIPSAKFFQPQPGSWLWFSQSSWLDWLQLKISLAKNIRFSEQIDTLAVIRAPRAQG